MGESNVCVKTVTFSPSVIAD